MNGFTKVSYSSGLPLVRGDIAGNPATPDGEREVNRTPRQLLMQDVTGERIESQPAQRNRDSRHMIAKAVGLLENLSHRGIRRDDIIGIGHPIEFDRGRTHHFFGEAMSGRADRLVFFRDPDSRVHGKYPSACFLLAKRLERVAGA